MLKAPRASSEHDRLALKAAVKRALALAGGAASFQHATRLHESNLSRAASPQGEDHHLPLDVALDLDREAGAPVVLSEFARLCGYRLAPLKAEAEGDIGVGDISRLMSASHKTNAGLLAAIEDSHVSPSEAKAVAKDIDATIRELTALRGKLQIS